MYFPSFTPPLMAAFPLLPSLMQTAEVFFPQAVVRAREPNQEATAVDVTLRRKLLVNYGVQTTVFYRTVSGSATEDEDYIHEDSVTVFNGDQVEASITIQILPGREWFKEESFSLEIYRVEEGVIRDLRDVVTVIIEGGEGEATPSTTAWHCLVSNAHLITPCGELPLCPIIAQ